MIWNEEDNTSREAFSPLNFDGSPRSSKQLTYLNTLLKMDCQQFAGFLTVF